MGERRLRRHPVRHLRHDGAEADHERGKNHYVTHHAKLEQRSRNITTPATKPRPIAAAKATILAKRMTEVLTRADCGGYLLGRCSRDTRRSSLDVSLQILNRGHDDGTTRIDQR